MLAAAKVAGEKDQIIAIIKEVAGVKRLQDAAEDKLPELKKRFDSLRETVEGL